MASPDLIDEAIKLEPLDVGRAGRQALAAAVVVARLGGSEVRPELLKPFEHTAGGKQNIGQVALNTSLRVSLIRSGNEEVGLSLAATGASVESPGIEPIRGVYMEYRLVPGLREDEAAHRAAAMGLQAQALGLGQGKLPIFATQRYGDDNPPQWFENMPLIEKSDSLPRDPVKLTTGMDGDPLGITHSGALAFLFASFP